jgi:hypothetical protein
MAGTLEDGFARSMLPGKAELSRPRDAVPVASGIWRPERAARRTRRSPEQSRNELSSPICIAYPALPGRIFVPAHTLPEALGGWSPIRTVGSSPDRAYVQTDDIQPMQFT